MKKPKVSPLEHERNYVAFLKKRLESENYKLLEEAKKCVLLCGNCHTEVENGITQLSEAMIERTLS